MLDDDEGHAGIYRHLGEKSIQSLKTTGRSAYAYEICSFTAHKHSSYCVLDTTDYSFGYSCSKKACFACQEVARYWG